MTLLFLNYNFKIFVILCFSLNKTDTAVRNISKSLHHRIETAKEKENEFKKSFTSDTDDITERVETGVSQVGRVNIQISS